MNCSVKLVDLLNLFVIIDFLSLSPSLFTHVSKQMHMCTIVIQIPTILLNYASTAAAKARAAEDLCEQLMKACESNDAAWLEEGVAVNQLICTYLYYGYITGWIWLDIITSWVS